MPQGERKEEEVENEIDVFSSTKNGFHELATISITPNTDTCT